MTVAPAYVSSWLLKVPPWRAWDESDFLSMGSGGCTAATPRRNTAQGVYAHLCVWLLLFVSFLQKFLFAPMICSLMSYWSSAGLVLSQHLGLSQLFLENRYWISPRCQSFRKVMLDLISFHFALYVQWITCVASSACKISRAENKSFLSSCADLALPHLSVVTWDVQQPCLAPATGDGEMGSLEHLLGVPLPINYPKANSSTQAAASTKCGTSRHPCPTIPMGTINGTRVFVHIWLLQIQRH